LGKTHPKAEAKAERFIGDDGRRVGFGFDVGASAKAAAAEGEAVITLSVPEWVPFFGPLLSDYSIEMRGKGDVNAGSIGAGVKAHAYYDKVDQRGNVGIGGKVSAALGIDLDLNLSFGKKYKSRERPGY